MERKIGEIFEYNDEWYQCVESDSCGECSFFTTKCGSGTKSDLVYKVFGLCSKARRSDNKYAICKKLEKVGEPHWIGKRLMQPYELFTKAVTPLGLGCFSIWHQDLTIEIEIKQNQEDMEEKKNEELSNLENTGKNLKPFDLEAARSGKPVCTRDGRKARIICFDAKFPKTGNIVALVEKKNGEEITLYYYDDGHCSIGNDYDLMMLPEKHEGWIVIHKEAIYDKETAEKIARETTANVIGIQKIEWEE